MAGDWIKMRSNLWDDPRISGLADATKTSEATIIGGLYWLWATADQHTNDGFMPGMSLKTIDRKTAIKGFGVALVGIGWIEEVDCGIVISRFEEHNGASAKERAQTAKRVADFKAKGNAKVTPSPLPEQHQTVTSALPRVREREELTTTHLSSVIGTPETVTPEPPENATRGELCKKLRVMSVDAAPHLQAWADLAAFTDDEILAVAEIAKAKKPNERIHLNYLVPILKDKAAVKPTAKRDPPWWVSEASILTKGRELGIDPRPGELMPEFKSRIQSRLQAMEDAA